MMEQRRAALAAGAQPSEQHSAPQQQQEGVCKATGSRATPYRAGLATPVGGLLSRPATPGTAGRGFAWSGMGGTPSHARVPTLAAGTPTQQGAAATGPGLPPAQLSRVHAMLLEHLQQTTSCASEVQALEKEVHGWVSIQEQYKVEQELRKGN